MLFGNIFRSPGDEFFGDLVLVDVDDYATEVEDDVFDVGHGFLFVAKIVKKVMRLLQLLVGFLQQLILYYNVHSHQYFVILI